MAYRGPLQQDVDMQWRENAELRRLESGAPGSTELCVECDSDDVGLRVALHEHNLQRTIYGRFNVPPQFIVPRPPEPEHVPPTFVPPTLPNFYIY